MEGKTQLQVGNEKARAVYANDLGYPLLMQICRLHRVSAVEFASIFGMSRAQAYKIMNHEDFPSLPVAIAVARYFEVDVEWLFGWRVDDNGARRPLLIENITTNVLFRLSSKNRADGAKELIKLQMDYLRGLRDDKGREKASEAGTGVPGNT